MLPTATAMRPAAIRAEASPATLLTPTALQAVPASPRSRKAPPRAVATGTSAVDAAKLLRALESTFSVSDEAQAAYADLHHVILLAKERDQEVPCLGPGGEAWTSEEHDDQRIAADRCLACPAMVLCKAYADIAEVTSGTWGGVPRDRARRNRDRPANRLRGVPTDCRCGCGGRTKGGRYLSGHDSQHLSRLLSAVRDCRLEVADAMDALLESPRLQAKLSALLGVSA